MGDVLDVGVILGTIRLTLLTFGEPAMQISVKSDVEKALKGMSRLHKG